MSSGNVETLTTNTDTRTTQIVGPVHVHLSGTFGGGTATVKIVDPTGASRSLNNGAFTAATDTVFDFPPNSKSDILITLTGATSPSLVTWIHSN